MRNEADTRALLIDPNRRRGVEDPEGAEGLPGALGDHGGDAEGERRLGLEAPHGHGPAEGHGRETHKNGNLTRGITRPGEEDRVKF